MARVKSYSEQMENTVKRARIDGAITVQDHTACIYQLISQIQRVCKEEQLRVSKQLKVGTVIFCCGGAKSTLLQGKRHISMKEKKEIISNSVALAVIDSISEEKRKDSNSQILITMQCARPFTLYFIDGDTSSQVLMWFQELNDAFLHALCDAIDSGNASCFLMRHQLDSVLRSEPLNRGSDLACLDSPGNSALFHHAFAYMNLTKKPLYC
eukprot:762539-Hanusia_phi.AAC.7